MEGLLGRLMQKLSETFGGPHTEEPDSSKWQKRDVGGYPARKWYAGDPDSPTISGGYHPDMMHHLAYNERSNEFPEYQHLYKAMNAIGDMVEADASLYDEGKSGPMQGVTDYSTAKDMMDVNVRDFVKGVHSVNPPDTTKNIDKLIAPKKEPDALLKAIMRFGPSGSMKDWS